MQKKQAKDIDFPLAKVSDKFSSIRVGLNLGFQNTPRCNSGGAVCKFVLLRVEAAN